jgi:phage-related protein
MIRLARPVAKDVTTALGSKNADILTGLAGATREINKYLEIGANRLETGITRIVGRNPLSSAIARFSSSLGGQTDRLAQFFNKQSQDIANQAPKSVTLRIVNAVQSIYKAVSDNLAKAYNYVQAQQGILPAIARFMGGVRDFFKGLFRNEQVEQLKRQRENAQRTYEQSFDAFSRSQSRRGMEDAQRELDALFAASPLGRTQAFFKSLPGRAFNKMGGVFEGIGDRLSTFATDLRDRQVRIQEKRRGTSYGPEMYERTPMGTRRREGTQYLGRGIVGATENILPLTTKIFTGLLSVGAKTSDRLSNYFKGSALRTQSAWEQSANAITGKSWFAMVKRAVWTGVKIVTNLNHGAADVTAEAWDRSRQSVSQDMHQMGETAQATGQQIQQSMGQAATRSTGFLSKLGGSIGSVGKAGMAIGGAITGVGFGLQTAMYSLSTMGLVSEESSAQLNKFFEIFTLLGAAGGIVTPILGAIFSSLGAIGAIAGTVGTVIAGVGGAITSFVGLGSVVFAPVLLGIAAVGIAFTGLYLAIKTNFLGIGNVLAAPVHWIEAAWQGFVDRFGVRLMPIIQPALDVAQGLINALNHNPTERIPEAWEKAGGRITGQLFHWLDVAKWVGVAIAGALVATLIAVTAAANPVLAVIAGVALGLSALSLVASKIVVGIGAILDWFKAGIAPAVKAVGVGIGTIAGPLFGLSTILVGLTTVGTLFAAVLTAPVFAPWIAGATALGGAIAGVAFIWQRFRRQAETPAPLPIEPPEESRPGLRERAGARIREVRDAVGDRVGQVKQAGVDAAQAVAGQYQLFAGAAADIGIIRGTLQSSTSLQVSLMANLEGYLSRIAQSIDSLVDFSKPRSRPEPTPDPIGTSNVVASGQIDRPNVVKQAIGQAGAAIQDTAFGQNALGKILLSPILRAPLNAMGLKDAQENVAAAREKERIKQSLGQQRTGVQSGLIGPLKLFTRKDEFQEAIQSQLQQRELSLAQEVIGGSQSTSALVRDKYKDLVTTTTQNGQEETVLNKEGQAYLEEKLAGLISRQSGVFSQNELAATASKTGFNGTPEQLMQAALQGLRGKDKDAPSALEQAAAILPGERTDYQELASDSLSELVGVTQRIASSVEYIAALLQPKTKVPMSLASGASIPVAFQPSPPPEPSKPSLMDKAGNAVKSAFLALNIHAKTPVNTERTGIESLSAAATEIRDAGKTGDRPIEYTPIQKRIGDWLSDRFEQPKGVQARLSDQIGKPMPTQQGIDVDPTNALATSAINTERHWDNTTNAIASNINALVNTSADQGYELQKAVSEGSPGPTYWIRQHWQKTVNAIKGWLDGLGNSSEKTGEAVAQSLTIQEVLTDARSGIQQMGRSLLIFGGDLGNFTRRAVGAVLTLNLVELGDAVHDLGGNFGYFTQGISAGFSQMTGSAIAFGMISLAWATPFFVIFGAIAFTAAVIVANFLGLRTILTGVFRIGIGAGQILVSVLKGAGDTVKSLGTIAFGVFKALHGDFSVLDAGIAQFKISFTQMRDGVIEGLRTIGRGIRQIVTGIDEGIQQIFPSFKGIIHYVEQVPAALKDPEAIAKTLAQGIIQVIQGIGRAIRSIPQLVAQGVEQAFGLARAGINSLFLKIEQVSAYFRGLSFAEVGQRFATEFRGLGETMSRLPAKIMNAIEQLVPALKVPFNYLRQLVGAFVEEIRRSLPVGIATALGAGLDEARRRAGIFVEQLQSVVRSLFSRLGLGKQFAEITTTLQSRWQRLVGFISGLNLFGSIPTDMEQFSTVFVKGVDLAHSAWTRFTGWLSASKLFPNLWAQLESLSSRFTETVASIKERWEGFRGEFATGNLLSGFFDGMRQLGTRFQDFVMNLEERWRGFARVIPGIPLFQSLFTELFVLGDRFTNLASFLERQWQRVAGFLGTTSLVGGAIASVEFLGRKFTEVIGFIRGAWEPFTSFLNSGDLFSNAFAQVRHFGESIPGLVESSKATFLQVKTFVEGIFQDLPSTMSGTIAWIEGAWREFTARFESILSPIVDFARTIAQWLIDALNHNPTVRIPESWQQAVANIKGFIESLVAPAQAVAERLVGIFQSATTRISEFWQGFSQVFGDRVLPALNTLKPHLDELAAGFQSFSERLQMAIAPIADRLGQAVSQVRGFIEGLSSAKPVLDSTGASAINFGELLANGLAGAISIVERMAPAISTVLGVLGNLTISFIEFSDRTLAGLAPTLEMLRNLSDKTLRFGAAFIETIGTAITPAAKELLPVIGKLLAIFGRIGTVIAAIPIGVLVGGFVAVSAAIKALLPLFEPINERTKEFLNSLGSAQDMGRAFGEILGNSISGVINTLKILLEIAATVEDALTAPLRFIDAAWERTGNAIGGVLGRLRRHTKDTGKELQGNLSEASPGPTYWMRKHWGTTADFIQHQIDEITSAAKAGGKTVQQNIGVDAADATSGYHKLGQGIRSIFMSTGSALSNFAPQLATPLFVLNDFVDLFLDLKDVLPQIRALFGITEAATTANAVATSAANGVIAASEGAVGVAAAGAAAAQVEGAITSSAAATNEAAAVGGANSFMATTYGLLANAARSAYVNMIAPLIPLLPWIVGISAAIFLFYQGFKNNFLGIGDGFKALVGGIKEFFGLLFGGAWGAIASIFTTIERQIQLIWRTIQRIGSILLEPFRPIFDALGIRGGQSPIVTAVNLILFPLRVVVGVINLIVTLMGGFIRGVVEVGGIILNFVLLPLRIVWAVIGGIVLGVNTALSRFGDAINHFLALPMAIAGDVLMQVARTVASIGRGIVNFILAPFYFLEQILQRAIAPIINVVLQAIGAIAITIGTVVGGFLLVTQAGAILAGVVGLIQAGMVVVGATLASVVAVGSTLMGVLAFIAQVIAPAMISAVLPFLPIIAAIVVGAFLIKTAFDIIARVIGGVVQGLSRIFNEVFGVLFSEIGNIWKTIVDVGQQLIEPFRPLMELFGAGRGGNGILGSAIQLAVQAILLPIRVLAGVLVVSIRLLSVLIQGVVRVGGFLISLLLAPLRLVQNMVLGIVKAFSFLGQILYNIFVTPFQQLWRLLQNIIGSIQGLPFIGGLFGGTPSRDANTATNIQQFAGGGLVKGSGDAGIPVIAHAGEFVVTTEATQANLGVLEYLNAGGQLALPTPTVGVMPPVPLALPTPVAVPAGGAGSGSVVIENVNLNFEVQINTNNGTEAGEEFLRYIEDPRFKRAVRQSLREMVERTK